MTINIINEFYAGIQPLIEYSPHLYSLAIDARRSLIKHNTYATATDSLSTLFLFGEVDVYSNSIVWNASMTLYGYDITKMFARNSNKCDPNGNLIKILISVLVFSSSCSIVTFDEQEYSRTTSSSIDRIEIENIYVMTFWKYFVYLYEFDGTVLRFFAQVKRMLNLLYLAGVICNNVIHNQMVDTIVAETERSLIIKK